MIFASFPRFLMLAMLLMQAPGVIGAPATPDVDRLLKDAGLPVAFWHKEVTYYGMAKDGRRIWVVSGDEFPKRQSDGECLARETTWTVAEGLKGSHATLYSDEETGPNPEYASLVNMDSSKRYVACEAIDSKEYFFVNDGIDPRQAMALIQDVLLAVDCVKNEREKCSKWKKLNISPYKADFLKLPNLSIFVVGWEDRDKHDRTEIQYLLYPPTEKSPYFITLDCLIRVLPDGSMELETAEGGPDP